MALARQQDFPFRLKTKRQYFLGEIRWSPAAVKLIFFLISFFSTSRKFCDGSLLDRISMLYIFVFLSSLREEALMDLLRGKVSAHSTLYIIVFFSRLKAKPQFFFSDK